MVFQPIISIDFTTKMKLNLWILQVRVTPLTHAFEYFFQTHLGKKCNKIHIKYFWRFVYLYKRYSMHIISKDEDEGFVVIQRLQRKEQFLRNATYIMNLDLL